MTPYDFGWKSGQLITQQNFKISWYDSEDNSHDARHMRADAKHRPWMMCPTGSTSKVAVGHCHACPIYHLNRRVMWQCDHLKTVLECVNMNGANVWVKSNRTRIGCLCYRLCWLSRGLYSPACTNPNSRSSRAAAQSGSALGTGPVADTHCTQGRSAAHMLSICL